MYMYMMFTYVMHLLKSYMIRNNTVFSLSLSSIAKVGGLSFVTFSIPVKSSIYKPHTNIVSTHTRTVDYVLMTEIDY